MPPINPSPCPQQPVTAEQMEQAFCNALTNCLPKPLEVTADATLTALLESIADDIIAQVEASSDDLANSLEEVTVTIDTTAGPVVVSGTVSISGAVTVDWTGIQTALDGLEVEVTNYQDLVDLLTAPTTTLTVDGTVTAIIDAAQFSTLETLLANVEAVVKAVVRKDWEVVDFCIVDAAGENVPLVGVFTERGYDYLGNQVSEVVVYSQFDPTGPDWVSYTLQAGDEVVECSRQTQNTVMLIEGCAPDGNGGVMQAYVGVNSVDGSRAWGPLSKGDLGFVSCCEVDTVQGCLQMFGFDYYAETDYSTGDTTSFAVNGGAPIVIDYVAISDGVNKSSWYAPVIAAVNALGPWTMSVVNDASVSSGNRVLYQIDYNGAGSESLVIVQSNDTRTLSADATGAITGTALDGVTPFGTDPFQACASQGK